MMPLRPEHRLAIFGAPVDMIGPLEALKFVEYGVHQADSPVCILDLNPEKVCLLADRPGLMRLFWNASVVLADGVGVVLAARLLHGTRLPRVPGADLMEAICAVACERDYRIFLFGASEAANTAAAAELRRRHRNIKIVGCIHGYVPPAENGTLIDEINASGAEILFVGLGSPRQEEWIAANLPWLRVKVCQAVGGALDTISGNVRRAPKFVRCLGLEWAFRLLQQPVRCGRQIRLLRFAIAVLFAALCRRASALVPSQQ